MKVPVEYKLEIFENAAAFNKAAGEFIIAAAKKSVAEKGKFTLSLSGGKTPESLYQLLAEPAYIQRMPWKNTFVFWGDERCVPLADERNNAYHAKILLLDKTDIPSENIFIIPVNLPPVDAALQYEKELKDLFKNGQMQFDLMLLGLGENGHTASLFPHTDILNEKSAGVRDVYVAEEKVFRVSMTAPLINNALRILFLVTGEKKATVLKTVLKGDYQPETYPAQLINPEKGELYWFTDREAASQLNLSI